MALWFFIGFLVVNIFIFALTRGWLWKLFIAIGFAGISLSLDGAPPVWLWYFTGIVTLASIVAFAMNSEKWLRYALNCLITITAIMCIYSVIYHPKPNISQTKPTPAATQKSPNPTEKAKEDLAKKGWKEDQYSEGNNVDESKDKSTAGAASFKHQRVTNITALIEWLKSGTKASKVVLAHIASKTGATSNEILNPDYWVRIQPKVPFKYPGNTGLSNDKVIEAGIRNGEIGDIFFAFVSKTGKIAYLRGGCANPQILTPEPDKTEKEPLKPKDPSKDVGVNPKVAPWKQDDTGGDPAAGHQVTNENGATVSNGLQTDPAADAAAAKAAADKIAADNAAAHAKAIADAKAAAEAAADKSGKPIEDVVVDKEQDHTESTSPPPTW